MIKKRIAKQKQTPKNGLQQYIFVCVCVINKTTKVTERKEHKTGVNELKGNVKCPILSAKREGFKALPPKVFNPFENRTFWL